MPVNYKVGADVGDFKQGMQEAQASLRTLDAALKNNEASLKAGGNAQIYMEQKTKLLNDKMQQQKKMADQLKDAMKKMAESGVSKTSVEYQRLQQQLLQAQTGMNETSYALNHLTEAEQEAAGGAEALTKSVNSIGKKISLDQVINGIGTITGAMEKAAGKAVQLGEAIWDNVMNSAKWADETQTIAQMYEIPLERYLRMQKLAQYETETSVDAMLKSQQKLKKNIGSGGDSFYQTLIDLGLAFENVGKFGETSFSLITNDADELFWKAGQAIMGLSDAFDKEAIAQEVFGKGWLELYDLFKKYGSKEAYDQALEGVHTNTEQEVSDLSELNDKVAELQGNIETLTNKGWAALAPSLTGAADALNGLLGNVLEYLDKPEGKEALESLGTSVSGLFEDLGKINPESVVENFTKVFDKLVGGFKWINEHKGELKTALTVIAGGWATATLTKGALQVLQLVNGIRGLTAGSAAEAGAAAGASWGGGFAAAVAKAAPWLIGIYTLLNPGNTGDDSIVTPDGKLLDSAKDSFILDTKGNPVMIDRDYQITDETILAEALKNKGNRVQQPVTIDLTWDSKPTSTMGEAGLVMTLLENSGWREAIHKWTEEHSASNSSILGKPGQLMEEWNALFGGNPVEAEVEPTLAPDAKEILQKQVSEWTVTVGAQVIPINSGAFDYRSGAYGEKHRYEAMHANGIWSVPFDGYPAILHRGEQVVPAREVSSRSYNSNLYVEKMIMNNGTDAEGLASAMAAAQRRRMSGYGS